MREIRIGMAQINPTVGDLTGNTSKIKEYIDRARSLDVDLLTFPELAITGYPPEDLLLKPKFVEENLRCLNEVVEYSRAIAVIVGFVDADSDLFNAAAVIADGRLIGVYHKIYLPNYGVFDEFRYFRAGDECQVFTICGVEVGISICEDIWYEAGPVAVEAYSGAQVLVNIGASPYSYGKTALRERMLATRASDNIAIVAYNNMVGGQDELVFDGGGLILDQEGNVVDRGKQFEEDLIVSDLDVEAVFRTRLHDPRWRRQAPLLEGRGWKVTKRSVSDHPSADAKAKLPPRSVEVLDYPAEVYKALVLGTRDYVHKNGFDKVVIGLSGGIDSSLVAAIATDALGPSNVIGVSMPSMYSSTSSRTDAEKLARNLGIRFLVIPINRIFEAYLDSLSEAFKGTEPNVAEENLQARARGNILMALSNKFGWLVLTTGNKSEMATGYSTLYGDMAGGFAVIKDVPKTMVYDLARYRNGVAGRDLIPRSVIEKVPSAELRPNQKDTDTLPPYEVLDPILKAYVEQDRGVDQIISMGFDEEYVRKAARLVDRSEYKRRQAPPGIKITPRAFGKDRRLPITNKFQG